MDTTTLFEIHSAANIAFSIGCIDYLVDATIHYHINFSHAPIEYNRTHPYCI